MKNNKIQTLTIATTFLFIGIGIAVFIQIYAGSLTPPGSPSGTMKSLDDIAGSGFSTGSDSLKQISTSLSSVSLSVDSISAGNGMYNNKISNMTPPAAYTEVCFKNGSTSYDAHSVSESTAGGNCVPGDVGYIIEKNERSANYWEMAKQTCLQNNMRLPEPFEWKLACKNAATWSLSNMTGNNEWASNFSLPMLNFNGNTGIVSILFGSSGCGYANWDWVGYSTGFEGNYVFRCVR